MREVVLGLALTAVKVGGLVTLVAGLAFWQYWRVRDRLRRWARAHGWQYSARAEGWRSVARRLTFGGGHLGPAVSGVFDGWQVTAFRVRPRADSVDSKIYVVVAVALPVMLPEVSLRPRTWASGLVAGFGAPQVRTGVPAFDDRYLLQARDLVAARGLLRPPLTERLLQVAPMPIVVVDGWAIAWVSARDVPEAIARQLPAATWVARELAATARR